MAAIGFSAGDLMTATQFTRNAATALSEAQENTENRDSTIVLSFRALQALRIKELQDELLELSLRKANGSPVGAEPGELNKLNEMIDSKLDYYASAIRNYETLAQERVDSPLSALFKKSARWDRLLATISGLVKKRSKHPKLPGSLKEMITQDPEGLLNFRELNKEVRRAKERKQAFSERVWMGVFGGVAVIAPMLLMSLHRTLNTSLITSSVATALFALVLAVAARNLKGQEVLGATAAYAAVLVVFVGTSMAPVS